MKKIKRINFIKLDVSKNEMSYGVNDKPIITVAIEKHRSVFLIKARVVPQICDFFGLIPIVSTVIFQRDEAELLVDLNKAIEVHAEQTVLNLLVETGLDRLFTFAKEKINRISWDGNNGRIAENYCESFSITDVGNDGFYDAYFYSFGGEQKVGRFCDIELAKAYCERFLQ